MHVYIYIYTHIFKRMGVSKNDGTPKSSILIGFSIINHPFWDTPIFGNTHIHRDLCSIKVCHIFEDKSCY